MKNVVVVGSQWGDEGKGKIVDWLSSEADVVVRFQGGHNAGHTLVIDKKVFKLRLLPSGIVRKRKISILGNGVVIDPWALLNEIEEIKKQGVSVTPENFMISESSSLILPFHQEMDEIREDAAGKGKIGTTRRGIGPCYEDKVGRRSIRVMDLRSETNLDNRLENVLSHHNAIRKGLNKKVFEKDKLKKELLKIAPEILKFAQPVWLKLDEFNNDRKKILFEGAQGILLDVDHGTYPYVTSSSTVPAMAATGSGSGPNKINYVLGITKAYTTRVGSGPFPTELNEIKMCIGYELNGKKIDYLPAASEDQFNIKPIYKTFSGWKSKTQGIRNLKDLPYKAKRYIHALEDFIGARISSISTSPERDDTILVEDPFDN